MPSVVGGSLDALTQSLRFRLARQANLASNVVNADTPGYRRSDLRFEAKLSEAAVRLQRSDPRHLQAGGGTPARWQTERGPRGTRPDGNGVDLQHELVQFSRNASAFTSQATVMSRVLALRRIPIAGETR